MIERLIEQHGAISVVLMESTKASDRDLILTPNEITQLENVASVLRPLQEANTILSTEKAISISLVQLVMAANMKSQILTCIQDHFSESFKSELMLMASAIDPHFKSLKFLPSSQRSPIYTSLTNICTSITVAKEDDTQRRNK